MSETTETNKELEPGNHIPASPQYVAAFIHATMLSINQLRKDIERDWGPLEKIEMRNSILSKLNLIEADRRNRAICEKLDEWIVGRD